LRLQKKFRRRDDRLWFSHRGGRVFDFPGSIDALHSAGGNRLAQQGTAGVKKIVTAGCVVAIGTFSLLPFLWFVLTSWKTPNEISAIPPVILPSFHWHNYPSAIEEYGLLHYIANSVIVASATTLISIAIAA